MFDLIDTDQILDFLSLLLNKAIWVLSIILGAVLSAIGYPKQVLTFIFVLVVIDIITKHYSIVVQNYKVFNIKNYIKAWKERKLTSRGLKNGIGVKALLYLPWLFVAHQAGITKELIGGQIISNVLYSFLLITEFRSVLENFEDCGYTQLKGLLKYFSRKQDEILGENNKKEGDK